MIGLVRKFSALKTLTILLTISFSLQTKSTPDTPDGLEFFEKNIPTDSVKPFISTPVGEEEIPRALNLVTNKLPQDALFLSFISENPSQEELKRAEVSESIAKEKGLEVVRVSVPVQEALKNVKDLSFRSELSKVKSYFGKSEVNLDKKPADISTMPTPVEKRLAIFYPLKSGIVKPIAWAAHTSAVGLVGLFSVSVTYSYFTSTYWHAFRVFFNTPHGLGPDSKLKRILEKINPAEVARKFRIPIGEGNFAQKLSSLNGYEIAKIIQFSGKKFALDIFSGELYKLAALQSGFFTAEYHLHILTSKLYSMTYYPVAWIEDNLVLKQLIKRDTIARIMLFKSYLGGALATWDLAGGMVPYLEVRPGILLTAFNASSLLAYFVYKKYAIWKLGLKDPKKFEEYVAKKSAVSKRLLEMTAELQNKGASKLEIRLFYDRASKLETIAEMEAHLIESKRLHKELLLEIEYVKENKTGLKQRLLLRQLNKVRTLEDLNRISQKLRPNQTGTNVSSRYTNTALSLRGNCLPLLRGLFAQ